MINHLDLYALEKSIALEKVKLSIKILKDIEHYTGETSEVLPKLLRLKDSVENDPNATIALYRHAGNCCNPILESV